MNGGSIGGSLRMREHLVPLPREPEAGPDARALLRRQKSATRRFSHALVDYSNLLSALNVSVVTFAHFGSGIGCQSFLL